LYRVGKRALIDKADRDWTTGNRAGHACAKMEWCAALKRCVNGIAIVIAYFI
jgi:hypothetical protein